MTFKRIAALCAALFFATAAYGQAPAKVANHAFAIGKGANISGYTSILCGNGQIPIGQTSADPLCVTVSGDAAVSAAGVLTLATVNANVGTFGTTTRCITTTQNAKGLTTAISDAVCTPAIGSITGLGTGVAAALGVNLNASGGIISPTPSAAGDILWWNGSAWVVLTGNNTTTKFLQENASGTPSWVVASGTGTVTTLTSGQGISFSSGATCTSTCIVTNTSALQKQFFSASGTFTTPSTSITTTVYHFTLIGPGGGGQGGATGSAYGSAGAAGGMVEFWCTGVAASTGISLTIGTGGAGGAAAGGNGTAGSAATTLTCNGTALSAGAGGGGVPATGGVGGTATGGDINTPGQYGTPGGSGTPTISFSVGGNTKWGAGGMLNNSTGVAQPGTGCGSGGSGGFGAANGGAAGKNGCVLVDWIL